MNILQKVKRLEAGMTRAVERAAREWSQSGAREPLEIGQAIVDAVGERLEPAARGRYVFPFNRIHVTIAASRDARARFQALRDGMAVPRPTTFHVGSAVGVLRMAQDFSPDERSEKPAAHYFGR